ncbi:unnamed protein product [Rotaria socialis]|uniref:C1q domain-containing protein n=2 Tax=Rotaria socialis TaxID=392032 RepID=A0A818BE50_9BILA|nr:unnamed protein product [Rotaria socialis]
MACNLLYAILMLVCSEVLCKINRHKNSYECFAELKCGGNTNDLSTVVQGLPGPRGSPGVAGLSGPMGPRGLMGPTGRDGFTERPTSFCAELQYFDLTKITGNVLRPWILSDSFNVPTVSNDFSENTGIFTIPKNGFYQFFVTISISRTKASFDIRKNDNRMCTIWTEAVIRSHNETTASGWSNAFIDCLLYCQVNDRISIVIPYYLNENFDSETLAYLYSTFSGYLLFNI